MESLRGQKQVVATCAANKEVARRRTLGKFSSRAKFNHYLVSYRLKLVWSHALTDGLTEFRIIFAVFIYSFVEKRS